MKALMRTMTIDGKIRILERFNERVERLEQRGFVEESRGGGAIVEWRKGHGWDGFFAGPSDKTVEATVLTLRLFMLSNESTSLSKMQTLYSDSNVEPRLVSKFTEIRNQLNCYLDSESNLSISEDGPMTHREIFDLFVNGDLAHANNATTEANYRAIRETPMFPVFQSDFTLTVQIIMSALSEMQQVNCLAIEQLRRGERLA